MKNQADEKRVLPSDKMESKIENVLTIKQASKQLHKNT